MPTLAAPSRRLAVGCLSLFVLAGIPVAAARGATLLDGGVQADTLDADPHLVRVAMFDAFTAQKWELDPATAASDTLATAWRPVRSMAVRLLVGDVRTRCQVECSALPDGRTRAVFHAVALAAHPIESAALIRAGEKANAACARGWFARLRETTARLAQTAGAPGPVALRVAP